MQALPLGKVILHLSPPTSAAFPDPNSHSGVIGQKKALVKKKEKSPWRLVSTGIVSIVQHISVCVKETLMDSHLSLFFLPIWAK